MNRGRSTSRDISTAPRSRSLFLDRLDNGSINHKSMTYFTVIRTDNGTLQTTTILESCDHGGFQVRTSVLDSARRASLPNADFTSTGLRKHRFSPSADKVLQLAD